MRRQWPNKTWTTKKGTVKGGRPFDKCSLHALLTNPIYIGKIKHKTQLYEGQHEPIIETNVFDRVQTQLRTNNHNRSNRLPNRHGGLLKGLLRCPHCNVAMVHNVVRRDSRTYRYYTCMRAIKRGRQHCKHPSLPAGEIEAAVIDQVRAIADDAGLRNEIVRQAEEAISGEKSEFEIQRQQLSRQLSRDHAELKRLVTFEQPSSATTARIADLHERISKAEQQLSFAQNQIAKFDQQKISSKDVADAFAEFDRVWNSLTTREQAQLLALLVAKVEFDHRQTAPSRSRFIPAAFNPLTSCKPRKSSDNDQTKTQCQRGGSRSQDDPAPQSR